MIPTDEILEAFHLEGLPMNLGRGFGTNQFLGTSCFLLFLYYVPSGLVFFALWSCVVLPTRPTIFYDSAKVYLAAAVPSYILLWALTPRGYSNVFSSRSIPPTWRNSSNLVDLVRFRHTESSLD
jgi:hypothetical protein